MIKNTTVLQTPQTQGTCDSNYLLSKYTIWQKFVDINLHTDVVLDIRT